MGQEQAEKGFRWTRESVELEELNPSHPKTLEGHLIYQKVTHVFLQTPRNEDNTYKTVWWNHLMNGLRCESWTGLCECCARNREAPRPHNDKVSVAPTLECCVLGNGLHPSINLPSPTKASAIIV